MDFNKLTLKSQEAVAAAQELARRMGNPELYPEHLVLALLDQELPRELVPDPDSLRAEAEAALRAKPSTQGAAQSALGVLTSAIANATENESADADRLVVRTIAIDPGPVEKRWLPRSMGRANRINKRSSHVTIEVDTEE